MTGGSVDRQDRVRRWRHDLHRCPELAFEERATSDHIAGVLGRLGFEVARFVGGTGVVGSLRHGNTQRAIGFRADMDCLPLQDGSQHDPVSDNPGRMHACGHDGHMAMVLGAAAALIADDDLDGVVRVIFQPAEEPGRERRRWWMTASSTASRSMPFTGCTTSLGCPPVTSTPGPARS